MCFLQLFHISWKAIQKFFGQSKALANETDLRYHLSIIKYKEVLLEQEYLTGREINERNGLLK